MSEEIIGHGRRSEIISIDDNQVLKLYESGFPLKKIDDEFKKTSLIYKTNSIKIAKPIKIIERRNRTGIIFEKINGVSLMNLFIRQPWMYLSQEKVITDIHKQINKIYIKDFPTQQDEFSDLINNSEKFNSKEKELLIQILNKNYKPVLCHGDFHQGNIIKLNKDYYVIDWMDSFMGDYKLDVALTAVNAAVSDTPKHIQKIYSCAYELIKKIIKLDERYLKLYGTNLDDMKVYILLASSIHLANSYGNNELKLKYFKEVLTSREVYS